MGSMLSVSKRFTAAQALVAGACVVLVLIGILFARTPIEDLAKETRAKEALLGPDELRAREELRELREVIAGAQRRKRSTLFRITGSGCSDCACRGTDLRRIADASACMGAWQNVLKGLDVASAATGSPARYSR